MLSKVNIYTKEFKVLMNQSEQEFYSPKNKRIIIDQIIEVLKYDANQGVFYEVSKNSSHVIKQTLCQTQSIETQVRLIKKELTPLSPLEIIAFYDMLRVLNTEEFIKKEQKTIKRN